MTKPLPTVFLRSTANSGKPQNRKDSPPFRVKNQRSGVVVDFSTSGPFSPEST
jgi:hypothetical protein